MVHECVIWFYFVTSVNDIKHCSKIKYVTEFRQARIFLGEKWKKPTLVIYSDAALVPFLQTGDFVVGNTRQFYQKLIPTADIAPRIPGGHLIQYDKPKAVSQYIVEFFRRHDLK